MSMRDGRRVSARCPAIAVVVGLALALQACGTSTVSRNVYDNGRSGQVVFPDIASQAWLREGTFPNLDNLRLIAPGITKDQLYALIGRPHFDEGMVAVREWDYIFNFRTEQGAEYVTCQYKVIFDRDYTGRSFLWKPESCANRLDVAPPVQERIVERVIERFVGRGTEQASTIRLANDPRVIRLSTDLLFALDRSGPNDLTPDGIRAIDRLARELLASTRDGHLQVVGHTDRLGSETHNQTLSEARARTIRGYLIARGFAADRVGASGVGMDSPVVDCNQTERAALVACLAPNRRVEIVLGTDAQRAKPR